MRLLFIKPKHIGDSLILTPTLVAARQAYPDAEIWVMVRRGCEGILAGCPEIDRILLLAAVDKASRTRGDFWRELGIALQMPRVKFDYVFELGDGHRARLFAMLARTRRRYSVRPSSPLQPFERWRFSAVSDLDWNGVHRVEKDYRAVAEFLPLPEEIPPLRFARERTKPWPPADGLSGFAVVQIGTRQGRNRWARERWLEVVRHLLERCGHVVLTCGADPAEVAEADSIQAELGPRALCTRGEAGWAQIADLFYRASICVTPMTAAMHLAAACACPIVAVCGPVMELHWRPWRAPHRIVSSDDCAGVTDPSELVRRVYARTMDAVPASAVIRACDELLASELKPSFRS